MTPILVIINPTARSERARALCRKIEHLSTQAYVRITNGPGEARALAEQAAAEGCERVVAAGGDGTINEVVNGIAGSQTALGLLPLGTMNVFATELGLPIGNLKKCWDIIENGQVKAVDLLRANDRILCRWRESGLTRRSWRRRVLTLEDAGAAELHHLGDADSVEEAAAADGEGGGERGRGRLC